MTTTFKYVPYVPEGFEGETVDVVDALKRGRAVLVEEAERWTTGTWFRNDHPEVDIQDPYCNSWKVCAEGAVAIVTVGLHNAPLVKYPGDVEDGREAPWVCFTCFTNWDHNPSIDQRQLVLYEDGIRRLGDTGRQIRMEQSDNRDFASANYFNDIYFETPDEVIAWFDKAIEIAEAEKAEIAQR